MCLFSGILIVAILFCNIGRVCQDKLVKYITKYGYPAETHKIVTEDGYILKTHRIPHGKFSNKTNGNIAFLVHGMAGSADNFIILGPDDALGFMLADRGFDVWLFNARGTRHSRRHKTKSPNFFQGSSFWNFSWHEIGVYDLPANIDYILRRTNKTYLFYVSHSQGGTTYFVLTSERSEYNQKIKAAALLAPAVLMNYTKLTLAKFTSKFNILLERLASMFNYYELVIPNSSTIINKVLYQFCTYSSTFTEACRDFLSILGGEESGLVNITLMSTIAEYSPSAFSVYQPLHYTQIIRTGYFRQHDYGKNTNLIKYNRTVPPEYNLKNSVTPVALFVANGDYLVTIKSVQELSKILPNVAMLYEVPHENFNHVDYLFAHNAKELVYEPVYDFFMQFVND